MRSSRRFHSARYARQTGVVLVIALVMLLLITIVGISAVKTLTLEERMSSNSIDRNSVFQSSEWALSVAEQVAETQAKLCNGGFVNQGVPTTPVVDQGTSNGNGKGNGSTPAPTPTTCTPTACQNGLCGYPQPNCAPRWEDSSFTGWAPVKDPNNPSSNLVTPIGTTPQYFIEYLYKDAPTCAGKPNDGPFRYRITVRTQAGEGRANVMLQSIYGE